MLIGIKYIERDSENEEWLQPRSGYDHPRAIDPGCGAILRLLWS